GAASAHSCGRLGRAIVDPESWSSPFQIIGTAAIIGSPASEVVRKRSGFGPDSTDRRTRPAIARRVARTAAWGQTPSFELATAASSMQAPLAEVLAVVGQNPIAVLDRRTARDACRRSASTPGAPPAEVRNHASGVGRAASGLWRLPMLWCPSSVLKNMR